MGPSARLGTTWKGTHVVTESSPEDFFAGYRPTIGLTSTSSQGLCLIPCSLP